MNKERETGALLRDLDPVLDEREFGFGHVPAGNPIPAGLGPLGAFREAEGTTVIAPSSALGAADIQHEPGWAKITLQVPSPLSAIGLTAAVATGLANAGISANVVAAYHHDHVFVPWTRREDAMEVLRKLARQNQDA